MQSYSGASQLVIGVEDRKAVTISAEGLLDTNPERLHDP